VNSALQILCQLADVRKAEQSPNFPARYIPNSRYNDRDANGLIRCLVDYLNFSGHFATHLGSTGAYRVNWQRLVSWQQQVELPDVFAVVGGRAMLIEVKHGKDQLSEARKRTIFELQKAGALIYIAHEFESFYYWFEQNIKTLNVLSDKVSLYPHPIPWLATPDLPPFFDES
jgi:hypothetical protein